MGATCITIALSLAKTSTQCCDEYNQQVGVQYAATLCAAYSSPDLSSLANIIPSFDLDSRVGFDVNHAEAVVTFAVFDLGSRTRWFAIFIHHRIALGI